MVYTTYKKKVILGMIYDVVLSTFAIGITLW